MERVGPGLGDRAHNGAGLALIFRRIVISDDLEFLHRLGANVACSGRLRVVGKIPVVDPVQQVHVVAAAHSRHGEVVA